MPSVFGKLVRNLFGTAGFEIRRKPNDLTRPLDRPTGTDALMRLSRRGVGLFNTVIDVGASDGIWSEKLMHHVPSADYFLIEALPVHESGLKAFCTRHPNASYVLAAAAAEEGEISFATTDDPFGGGASGDPTGANNIRLPATTIDAQVAKRRLRGPFLIKLDTHGFEVPILAGAKDTLEQTDVLVIECYNFTLTPGCLQFFEMCEKMRSMGFRCIDLFDIGYRPGDTALWQMDMVFMRADRPEFQDNTFHCEALRPASCFT